jgi:hypothetical protein
MPGFELGSFVPEAVAVTTFRRKCDSLNRLNFRRLFFSPSSEKENTANTPKLKSRLSAFSSPALKGDEDEEVRMFFK